MYAFSEVLTGKENVPVGLEKMKAYGIRNPIFEIDLANSVYLQGVTRISLLMILVFFF